MVSRMIRMKADPGTLRKINERRIMNAIRVHKMLSRSDVQRELSLALPTVSRIVDALIERKWVVERGVVETSMGRPPIMVQINPEGAYAIGVDLGRTVSRIACVNLIGQVTYEEHFPTFQVDTADALLDRLEKLVLSECRGKNVVGVGIAAPGSHNPHPSISRGDVDERHDHHWHHEPLREMIETRLHLPAWVENDANAAVLGEMWFGVGQSVKHLLFVLADVGIGAGIAVNGSIYHGENNGAGEFAHTVVDMRNHDLCECGRRGCLGNVAARTSILDRVKKKTGITTASFAEVVQLAKESVHPYQEIVYEAVDYLAVGIANMVQVLDPTMIVLGGATFLEDEFVFNETVRRMEPFMNSKGVSIVRTKHQFNSVAIGAATLALQQVFDHTQLIDDPLHSQAAPGINVL